MTLRINLKRPNHKYSSCYPVGRHLTFPVTNTRYISWVDFVLVSLRFGGCRTGRKSRSVVKFIWNRNNLWLSAESVKIRADGTHSNHWVINSYTPACFAGLLSIVHSVSYLLNTKRFPQQIYTHQQFMLTLIRIMTREGHSFVSPGLITFVTSKLVSVLLFTVVFHLLPAGFKPTTRWSQFFSR